MDGSTQVVGCRRACSVYGRRRRAQVPRQPRKQTDGLHAPLCRGDRRASEGNDGKHGRAILLTTHRPIVLYTPEPRNWQGRQCVGRSVSQTCNGCLSCAITCGSSRQAGRQAGVLGTGDCETGQRTAARRTNGWSWSAWPRPGMQAGRRITLACANRDRDGEVSPIRIWDMDGRER